MIPCDLQGISVKAISPCSSIKPSIILALCEPLPAHPLCDFKKNALKNHSAAGKADSGNYGCKPQELLRGMRSVYCRPEPTVRPPSQFSVVKIGMIPCDLQGISVKAISPCSSIYSVTQGKSERIYIPFGTCIGKSKNYYERPCGY